MLSHRRALVGEKQADISFEGDQVVVDGEPVNAEIRMLSDRQLYILLDGVPHTVFVEERDERRFTLILNHARKQVEVKSRRDLLLARYGLTDTARIREKEVRAPMPGLVLDVLVKDGDSVEAGAALLVLEAMKMENEVRAPAAGTVTRIRVSAGDAVGKNDLLVEFGE